MNNNFAHATMATMGDDLVTAIAQRYGVQPARLFAVQKGYRNESHPLQLVDGRRANLIIYKNEPGMAARVRRANAVADFLAGQGMAVRQTLDPRIVRLESHSGGQQQQTRYASLYRYLPGETIPWEAYTQAHLKSLGKMQADMHGLLARYTGPALPSVAAEYGDLLGRMERYFAGAPVAAAMRHKLGVSLQPGVMAKLARTVNGCMNLPGQQALHMDFVRGNVLFDTDAHITGILDFEKTAFGHPLFDIARTLAFLLVDCKYKPEKKVRKYFLDSGYSKRGRSWFTPGPKNAPLLERLIDLCLLHDFYKFLRHNPYESLHQNEHYTRTAALLHRRGLLQPAGQQTDMDPGTQTGTGYGAASQKVLE